MELQGERGLLPFMLFVPSLTCDPSPLHFPAPTSSHYVYISISSTSGSLLLGQAEIEAKCLWRRSSGGGGGGGFLKRFGACLHICMSVVFRKEKQQKSPAHYKTAITNLLKCATVEVLIHSDKLFFLAQTCFVY